MTGPHHDWGVDGVLEGDVHRGVVSLVQLHLDLTVRHTVEADVKLNVHRLGHLNFHLENNAAPTSCDHPVITVTLDPEPTLRLIWTEVL